jgi:hypothetical protein
MFVFSVLAGGFISYGQSFPLPQKIDLLRSVYPDLFWVLFLFGIFGIVLRYINSPKQNRDGQVNLILVALYTIVVLCAYFIPYSGLNRVEIFARGFMSICASFSFLWIRNGFNSVSSATVSIHNSIRRLRTTHLFTFVLLSLSIGILLQPYVSYASTVPNLSNISRDEYLAAEWIEKNSSPGSYILTDPSTGFILRGLTLRNASTAFILDGHTPSPETGPGANLSVAIRGFFLETDPFNFSSRLSSFPTTPDLIVITNRTSTWIKSNSNNVYCAPTNDALMSFPGASKFSTPFFSELFSRDSVKIFNISQARIQPLWEDRSLSEGWSWYLDGAYGNYTSTFNGTFRLEVQAKNSENAWMGISKEISNMSNAQYLRIKYRIDVPSSVLEIALWNSTGKLTKIQYLEQSQNWAEMVFPMDAGTADFTKISIIVWTKDAKLHTLEIDYVLIATVVSQG